MRIFKGFTAQEVATGVSRGYRGLLLAVCMLLTLPAWGAGGVLVVGDINRSYFRSFSSALVNTLGDGIKVTIAGSEQVDRSASALGTYRCVVTVGNDAARAMSETAKGVPLLYALVTDSFADELSPQSNRQSPYSFLLIDQPISRMIALARNSLPERRRLGVIYGPSSKHYRDELRQVAGNVGVQLIEREITEPGQLSDVMSSFNGSTDMLLTLPDPIVVNEGTAKTLILGAYLGNLPLIGYSQALVKAGALMSVHSTPEQLGQQAAELIQTSLCREPVSKGERIYPRYYQISVNYQVANALQITLPSESTLKKGLERMEAMR